MNLSKNDHSIATRRSGAKNKRAAENKSTAKTSKPRAHTKASKPQAKASKQQRAAKTSKRGKLSKSNNPPARAEALKKKTRAISSEKYRALSRNSKRSVKARKLTREDQLKAQVGRLRRQVFVAERMRFEALKQQLGESKKFNAHLFAAGVAHEFNNILGAADGHAQWALESGKPQDMREALEIVRLACRRSIQITRALRGLTQPKEEHKEIFDFRKLTNEVEKIFSPLCREQGIALVVQSPSVQIYGNDAQLLEIFVNLIRNACEAITHANIERPEVRITATVESKRLHVLFQNNGPEIPVIYKDLLFQPFFTTKGSLAGTAVAAPEASPPATGTGLGLFLSRTLAQEHGGTLKLLEEKKGVHLELILPLP